MTKDELEKELELEAHRDQIYPLIDDCNWMGVFEYIASMNDPAEGLYLVYQIGLVSTDIGDWDE